MVEVAWWFVGIAMVAGVMLHLVPILEDEVIRRFDARRAKIEDLGWREIMAAGMTRAALEDPVDG